MFIIIIYNIFQWTHVPVLGQRNFARTTLRIIIITLFYIIDIILISHYEYNMTQDLGMTYILVVMIDTMNKLNVH